MFPIKNNDDLRAAYVFLETAIEFGKSTEKLAEIKREIRKYNNKENHSSTLWKIKGWTDMWC